jgi:hypothetical protein
MKSNEQLVDEIRRNREPWVDVAIVVAFEDRFEFVSEDRYSLNIGSKRGLIGTWRCFAASFGIILPHAKTESGCGQETTQSGMGAPLAFYTASLSPRYC